jgi:hypothetical protein
LSDPLRSEHMPRQNPFWRSILLIAKMMFYKAQWFHVHDLSNFNQALKRSRRRARMIPLNIIVSECAETKLHSTFTLSSQAIHKSLR